ncbi:hypothetical protein [Halomonas llamarensis]|uniref:Glycosyltransferase RgtA/B/C/D-like domain-containing protein n=1 Tax=Halomonas llamarensis TaxID=2945104 RepID=A0ABT0SPV0_9GAMM|nr:hypothetical protein [Halomonas llamarensis]MCL7929593.1 hypothetical protein [Halomonas llamarensis]
MKDQDAPLARVSGRALVVMLGFALFIGLLVVHGALPGISVPTLGQANWMLGFAESMAQNGLFSVYATHFGGPEPAPIAFGLAGAWPTALGLRLGLAPENAFTAMYVAWLGVAFYGAYRVARHYRVRPGLALLAASAWLTLPMVWWHSQYSTLALGIALLPAYHGVLLAVINARGQGSAARWGRYVLYLAMAIIAVFMDGYTFMMAACGTSLLLLSHLWYSRAHWWAEATRLLPLHGIAFALAYLLFSRYIGQSHFDGASLAFFRGWGMDLTYLLRPSAGISWLWDTLHLSQVRDIKHHFGDNSVWNTTFLLPLLIVAALGVYAARQLRIQWFGWLAIALFGFYMALGPSLKVNDTRPADMPGQPSHMAAEHATLPTGSAFVSGHLPGFNNMRAAYRWAALGALGAWALLLPLLAYHQTRRYHLLAALLGVLIVSHLPHPERWQATRQYHAAISDIRHTLVPALARDLSPGERVFFIPYRNDFLINFIAPQLGIHAYNIGGDKNLALAKRHWPQPLREVAIRGWPETPEQALPAMLRHPQIDTLVVPYHDMLWAAHIWPVDTTLKPGLQPLVEALKAVEALTVIERDDYAIIRLSAPSSAPE